MPLRRSTHIPTHVGWGFILISAAAGGFVGILIGAGIVALLMALLFRYAKPALVGGAK